jgi:hypothetical protein
MLSFLVQEMLKVTDRFAKNNNIVFHTHEDPVRSKSKCLWFNGKTDQTKFPAPLRLDGKALPWVRSAIHLGHELRQECTIEHDAWCTRAKFIDRSVSVRDMFSFARPVEVLTATVTYFYGSNLWYLYGDRAQQCYRARSTAIKLGICPGPLTPGWWTTCCHATCHLLGRGY